MALYSPFSVARALAERAIIGTLARRVYDELASRRDTIQHSKKHLRETTLSFFVRANENAVRAPCAKESIVCLVLRRSCWVTFFSVL